MSNDKGFRLVGGAASKGNKVALTYKKGAKRVTECEWTRQMCHDLTLLGAEVHVLHGNSTSSGLPDRLIVHKEWQGLLEFKGNDTDLRVNQRIIMKRMLLRVQNFVYIVRKPDLIQLICDHSVNELGYWTIIKFDGTAKGLLNSLILLKKHSESEETYPVEPASGDDILDKQTKTYNEMPADTPLIVL